MQRDAVGLHAVDRAPPPCARVVEREVPRANHSAHRVAVTRGVDWEVMKPESGSRGV